ncbi:major facilitator superfamily domain-containing protein [Zychaea mexicana]|uniref:major facilitator superfamily domain-containing protein n=1 Tax=Zychaea mexicana TaxID=64656 RepID=UPI0022FE12DC|nr:major facilitator superfamily domain-containing protein [Zychaea mexicana]KAI9488643.1 major facilitator superfamily domain-containing protein [Zychaea mexicana]
MYALFYGVLSSVPPYLQLYYHDALGFSSDQIGFVLAIAPFIQSLACPLWTSLVDRRPKFHGAVMALTSFVGGLAVMGIMVLGHIISASNKRNDQYIPPPQSPQQLLVATGALIYRDEDSKSDSSGGDFAAMTTMTMVIQQPPQLDNHTVVWLISILSLLIAFFTLPNVSLVDSAVMKILGPNKILYGSLDVLFWVFGVSTVAFIVCALMTKVTDDYVQVPIMSSSEPEYQYDEDSPAAVSYSPSQGHRSTMLTIDGGLIENLESDAERTLRVGSHPGSHQQEEEKLLQQYNSNNYQTISAFHDNDNDDDGDGGHGTTTFNNNNNNKLFRPKSRHSIISTAHTLREEADEQLDRSNNNLDLSLAISRVTSTEHSLGAGVIGAAGGESSAEESGLLVDRVPETQELFKSPRVLCFLTTTLLFGVVLSMIVNFLFLFLNRDLHTPKSWIGWTGPLGGITELLCFCFSKQMTECLGTTGLVIVAHAATIIRCLAYTILPPDTLTTNISALLLQTLHGIGFGIFWGTAVSEMDSLFPPTQRAMAQGILGALHAGLGTGLGAFIGGYLYEYFGAVWLFRSAAGLACISISIFCVGRLKRFDTTYKSIH